MRKQIKEQVLNSTKNLVRTTSMLDEVLKKISKEEASDILGQMQGLAAEIGNTIESLESTNAGFAHNEVIYKLESACEFLYQLNCSLAHNRERKEITKKLKKIFFDIEEYIEKNVPGKLEVVFFPYQVSMWDSLESVWMAAKENPDIDCYVVPIPFYDVNSDNSLGDFHYEGDKYPDYVPVTSYQDYSVEERIPDIIFIHNPYDQYNRVTRVPEKYYASNLKRYTKKLVYIPYFVSEEGGPGDYQCSTSGILFADRVVVQPGSIYEKYCRLYTNVLKVNKLEDVLVPAAQKFLPFGSPKFDKVRNMKCQIGDLPKEWQNIIVKSDGSRKKIILYNVTIISVLYNKEQCLKKISSVLEFFKEKQDRFVLLWRPHPLLINTIDSMLPWMKEEYMSLVWGFREEGWGIYDETSDPNLSIALSDAYYGDSSSISTVYRETGKPMLLQNVWTL